MAINTDANLDNMWHILLTMASPYMLTFIMLCQEKSGLVCEQHRSSLANLPVDVATEQTEGELQGVAALNGALEQDIWVIRTLLLTCFLLSGQTPWFQWPSWGLVAVLWELLNDAAMHRWSDIGHPVGLSCVHNLVQPSLWTSLSHRSDSTSGE
jgi:hypothetical protein